jgi:hypothetical protein
MIAVTSFIRFSPNIAKEVRAGMALGFKCRPEPWKLASRAPNKTRGLAIKKAPGLPPALFRIAHNVSVYYQ